MAVSPQVYIHWSIEAPPDQMAGVTLDPIEAAVRRALAQEIDRDADLTVMLTSDEMIRRLNAQYRNLDEVTDVLSFPQQEGDQDFVPAPDGVLHLGDISVSVPQAARQAVESDQALQQELALLIVHGALHLAGYDHADPQQEKEMRERERAALSQPEEGCAPVT
jgi:probable rRNA maturation factor